MTLTAVRVDDKLVGLYDSGSPLRATAGSNMLNLAGVGLALDFPPAHGKIEFEFTALSFSAPENVHFRYRLRGFDQEWVEAGAQRSAKYPRLPEGRYQFEVTACNEVGVWNPSGASLAFHVQPFLWQTWWFRTALLAMFTGSVIGLVRYFSFRRLRREVEGLERQAELMQNMMICSNDQRDQKSGDVDEHRRSLLDATYTPGSSASPAA